MFGDIYAKVQEYEEKFKSSKEDLILSNTEPRRQHIHCLNMDYIRILKWRKLCSSKKLSSTSSKMVMQTKGISMARLEVGEEYYYFTKSRLWRDIRFKEIQKLLRLHAIIFSIFLLVKRRLLIIKLWVVFLISLLIIRMIFYKLFLLWMSWKVLYSLWVHIL